MSYLSCPYVACVVLQQYISHEFRYNFNTDVVVFLEERVVFDYFLKVVPMARKKPSSICLTVVKVS